MKKPILTSLLSFVFCLSSLTAQMSVSELRVEYMKNPVGIDIAQPRFSWKMLHPETRGARQTAYQITVSTSNTPESVVWTSGKVVSDKSVHILYEGAALQPATRYFWKVDVYDENNRLFSSNENAYFETGLLDTGWSNAKWLKFPSAQGTVEQPDSFIYETKFKIVTATAGPIFSATDQSNFFMWQINLEKQAGHTYLRPHRWRGGGGANLEDKDITSLINLSYNTEYNLKIKVVGQTATSFIEGIQVDERQNPFGEDYPCSLFGFRGDKSELGDISEDAFYDDLKVTAYKDGVKTVILNETFSNAANNPFTNSTIENGQLRVNQRKIAWQKPTGSNSAKFEVEADVTLISHNFGVIFSVTNQSNFYMWSINTHDENYPLLRRHYQDGSWHTGDVNLSQWFSKADLLNHERHIKISVENGVIKTYIDGTLVDTYTDTYGKLTKKGIGFRAYTETGLNEIAYYDNVKVTDLEGETPQVIFFADFENENPFVDTEIVDIDGNKKLKIFSRNGETRVFDESASGIPMFRSNFTLDNTKTVKSARIYTSGLGVYDVFINNQRVGTPDGNSGFVYDELKPGFTDYNKTAFYSTYDVTSLLNAQNNAVGMQVSSGWWSGGVVHGMYGNKDCAVIAKLVVNYTDGTNQIVVTNTSDWKTSTDGALRMGDIYNGETYDARKETAWTLPDFDETSWVNAAESKDFKGQLKAFVGSTVQIRQQLELTPVKITKHDGITATGSTYGMVNVTETHNAPAVVSLAQGETVIYDMGQNFAGWVHFKVKGAAGTQMRVRFSEMLNTDGSSAKNNDGPGGTPYLINLRSAKATLRYTLKGAESGEEFHPSSTFFGFRFVEVTATQPIEIQSIKGQVVGSATEEGASFASSNALVNKLYSNVQWGQRSNFLSVPTDCPQRDERLGWTGDIQIFGRTASYNADIASFFRKWMGDMRDSQNENGAYPHVAPYTWGVGYGASAWAEAGVTTPWTTYLMYSDKGILEENYESMEHFMSWLATQREENKPYIYVGGGTNYGDWVAYVGTDGRYISVCYYAYAALLMEKISTALGKTDKAAIYHTLYENIKAEFNTRYVNNSSKYLTINTQTAYLLALKLDLFPNQTAKNNAVKRLNTLLTSNGYKLNTGFVGTGILNQTLSEVGSIDMAYNLLLQRGNPSWLYSVDQGATTIWERWNSYTIESGFHQDISMNSFNHYAYGAVAEWMFRFMAGINPDENAAGFKHILLTPMPDFRTTLPTGQERITTAAASYNSYYGEVKSAWEIGENAVKYTVTVPANTTATLKIILQNATDAVFEGETPAAQVNGVTAYAKTDSTATLELKSGTYVFDVKPSNNAIKNLSQNGNGITLYPNPVDEMLYIKSENKVIDLTVYNNLGEMTYFQTGDKPLNMKPFASGVYFVQVKTRDFSRTIKILKS